MYTNIICFYQWQWSHKPRCCFGYVLVSVSHVIWKKNSNVNKMHWKKSTNRFTISRYHTSLYMLVELSCHVLIGCIIDALRVEHTNRHTKWMDVIDTLFSCSFKFNKSLLQNAASPFYFSYRWILHWKISMWARRQVGYYTPSNKSKFNEGSARNNQSGYLFSIASNSNVTIDKLWYNRWYKILWHSTSSQVGCTTMCARQNQIDGWH